MEARVPRQVAQGTAQSDRPSIDQHASGVEHGVFMAEIGQVDGHVVHQRLEIDRSCTLALQILPDERKGVFRHSLHFVERAEDLRPGVPVLEEFGVEQEAGPRSPQVVRYGRLHGHVVMNAVAEPVAHDVLKARTVWQNSKVALSGSESISWSRPRRPAAAARFVIDWGSAALTERPRRRRSAPTAVTNAGTFSPGEARPAAAQRQR